MKEEEDTNKSVDSNNSATSEQTHNTDAQSEESAVTDSCSKYTVYVGDLGDFTDEGSLDTIFGRFGPIQSIRIVRNKNCAFIKYPITEAAQNAIKSMNGEFIGGNKIKTSFARTSSRKPKKKNFREQDNWVYGPHDEYNYTNFKPNENIPLNYTPGVGLTPIPVEEIREEQVYDARVDYHQQFPSQEEEEDKERQLTTYEDI